jgi:hypothetical protein
MDENHHQDRHLSSWLLLLRLACIVARSSLGRETFRKLEKSEKLVKINWYQGGMILKIWDASDASDGYEKCKRLNFSRGRLNCELSRVLLIMNEKLGRWKCSFSASFQRRILSSGRRNLCSRSSSS